MKYSTGSPSGAWRSIKMVSPLTIPISIKRLRNALVAIHEEPTKTWSLEKLAGLAGMSRSVFATTFREVVGDTPGKYLQGWRIRLAQEAMKRGRPIKIVAGEVGYGSEVALSRAFKAYTGMSPRQWREDQLTMR